MRTKILNKIENKIENSKVLIILISLFLIFIIGGIIYLTLREDFICNIGKEEVVGDFKVEPNTTNNNQYCAVVDCVAFNTFQELNGGKERCVA